MFLKRTVKGICTHVSQKISLSHVYFTQLLTLFPSLILYGDGGLQSPGEVSLALTARGKLTLTPRPVSVVGAPDAKHQSQLNAQLRAGGCKSEREGSDIRHHLV